MRDFPASYSQVVAFSAGGDGGSKSPERSDAHVVCGSQRLGMVHVLHIRSEMIEFLAQMPTGTMIFLGLAILGLLATLAMLRPIM